MWKFIIEGGWVMFPLCVCSLFSLAIIIERLFFYFFHVNKFHTADILPKILEFVRGGDINQAVAICEKNPYHVTNILKEGLLHSNDSKEIIKDTMENASLYELPKLEKNLHFLNTIAQISTLLGLFGTVIGLVECFNVIEKKTAIGGTANPSDLARGIRVALHTTVVGLFVAIPSTLFYNYFIHKVSISMLEAERAANELLDILSIRKTQMNADKDCR